MPRRHWPAAAAAALLVLVGTGLPRSDAAPTAPTHRYIVRFADATTAQAQDQRVRAQGRSVEKRYTKVFHGMTATLDAASAERLRHEKGVLSVEPDRVVRAAGTQKNPPWNLDRVDQRSPRPSRSFTSAQTGAGVRIYVVDSGLNLAHTDFTGRVVAGPNFADATPSKPATGLKPVDCAGHGTHVAGIAAGTHHGIAKQATVVPVKILDCQGYGYESSTASALEWVLANHRAGTPAVVNLSIASPPSGAIDDATKALVTAGITVVTAAGNDGADACGSSPARVPAALTVANSTMSSRRAPDSNHGPCVDLFAPGTTIISDWIGSATATAEESGTSMSSPLVAGAAALVLQARPTWTPAQVSADLLGKATPNVLMGLTPTTPNRLLFTKGGVTP